MKPDKATIDNRVEQFIATAKQAGIKITHQRLEILRLIAGSSDHPGAEQIYNIVKKSLPTVSLDTVYRTLWLLSDLGILKPVGQRSETFRFDANLMPHHHFTCVKCGLIRDFTNQELDRLPFPPEVAKYGSTISIQVEIKGICEQCLVKQSKQQVKTKIKSRKKE